MLLVVCERVVGKVKRGGCLISGLIGDAENAAVPVLSCRRH